MYPASVAVTVAQLVALANVSLEKVGSVISFILSNPAFGQPISDQISKDFARQSLIAVSMYVEDTLARRIDPSDIVWLGCDVMSVKWGRSFLEVMVYAGDTKVKWESPGKLYELVEGGADVITSYLLRFWEELNEWRSLAKLPRLPLYNIGGISFDNASENTGSVGGVGALLEKERQKAWESEVGRTGPYIPLQVKGCIAHEANLFLPAFSRALAKLVETRRELSFLFVEGSGLKKLLALRCIKWASNRFRGIWAQEARGFCLKNKLLVWKWVKASKNR